MLWYHRDNHYDCVVREEDFETLSSSVKTSIDSSIKEFSSLFDAQDDDFFTYESSSYNWKPRGNTPKSTSQFPSSVLKRHQSSLPRNRRRGGGGSGSRDQGSFSSSSSFNAFSLLYSAVSGQDQSSEEGKDKEEVEVKQIVTPFISAKSKKSKKKGKHLSKKIDQISARENQNKTHDQLLRFLCESSSPLSLSFLIVFLA